MLNVGTREILEEEGPRRTWGFTIKVILRHANLSTTQRYL
jgi:hypothetical protein